MELPLGKSAYERNYGQMPPIRLENRFFEENPTDQQGGVALLSRPGTTNLTGFGAGPVRALFSLDGVFGGDLFVASGVNGALYRYARDGLTKTALAGTIAGSGYPTMAATSAYLFITDGTTLQYYNGVGNFATSDLTVTVNAIDGETVTIGAVTYTWKTALTPTANEVLIGVDIDTSLQNLALATLANGTGAGSVYAAATVPNPAAYGEQTTTGVMLATAVLPGAASNSVATTETMNNGSWTGATLSGGTANALNGITTPDDVAIVSLAVIAGYVLLVTAQSDKVYWIEPNITGVDLPVINPLNFFTAEQLPDQLSQVKVVGDEIWLLGVDGSEVWYVSGSSGVPFDRIKGRAFSRGIVEGSVVAIGSKIFLIGNDGVVYKTGQGLQRISTHAIEEKIRLQRKAERNS